MSIRTRVILVLAATLALTTIMAACSSGPTTVQIVETTKAQNKLDNAEATRQAVIDAGGDPDATVQVQIDDDSPQRQQMPTEQQLLLHLLLKESFPKVLVVANSLRVQHSKS